MAESEEHAIIVVLVTTLNSKPYWNKSMNKTYAAKPSKTTSSKRRALTPRGSGRGKDPLARNHRAS